MLHTSIVFPMLVVPLILGSVSSTRSQDQQSKVKIEKAPVEVSSEVSGPKLYETYCAVCHGKDGKGSGPATPALNTKPTDLTLLAKNNGGKFPATRVLQDLNDPTQAPHGSKDMPIWGQLFRQMGPSRTIAQLRAKNVTDYLKSIQEK
jgi:mono/diheme cytochrome c family protein